MRRVEAEDGQEPEWVLAALRAHEGPLLRYAASLVGETRAQDVVQDAFLRLCSQPQESVQAHLAAWLFTVCRNRAFEIRRADRRLSRIEEKDEMLESPDSGPVAKLERAEDLSRVGAAMAELPPKQREVLRLKIEAGLSYKFLIGDAPPHLDYSQDYDYALEARAAARRGIQSIPLPRQAWIRSDKSFGVRWRNIPEQPTCSCCEGGRAHNRPVGATRSRAVVEHRPRIRAATWTRWCWPKSEARSARSNAIRCAFRVWTRMRTRSLAPIECSSPNRARLISRSL